MNFQSPRYGSLLFFIGRFEQTKDASLPPFIAGPLKELAHDVKNIKTSYDRAMSLIVLSLAYKLFGVQEYKSALEFLATSGKQHASHDALQDFAWNILEGTGLILAYRILKDVQWLDEARSIFVTSYKQIRESFNSKNEEYLSYYVTLLLLVTYLHEEEPQYIEVIGWLREKVGGFFDNNQWFLKRVNGVCSDKAYFSDYPFISFASLAEWALLRSDHLLEKPEEKRMLTYFIPLESDFANLVVWWKNGFSHMIHGPALNLVSLPFGSVFAHGPRFMDCYKKMCRMFKTEEDLAKIL